MAGLDCIGTVVNTRNSKKESQKLNARKWWVGRGGPKIAIDATARKLTRVIYMMLREERTFRLDG